MALSAPGIGSGLDISSIVNQLMAVERQPLDALVKREQKFQAQLSAFGKVKSALSTFQTAVQGLSIDKLRPLSATPSDSSVFTATAGSTAAVGTYSLEVTQLAQQHKLVTTGFPSTSDSVGTGTLTIQFGTYNSGPNTFTQNADKASATITIDASNNSLAGVRDAINAAKAGVTASIINDGSTNGYRLVLTSNDSGAANSLRITASDGDGNNLDNSGLSALAFDPTAAAGSGKNLTESAAARNALLTLDGVSVSKSSNTITDAIAGVTLTLAKTNAGQPATLSVGRNGTAVTESVQAFVKAYNDINQTLKDQTAYNTTTKQGAALHGDSTIRAIQTQLRGLLNTAVGSTGTLTTLSQIGVTFQKDGTLAVDTAKLQTAVDNNFDDIASLFAATARATDSLVSYTYRTSKTQAGTYAVSVSQLATRGDVLGSQAAGLTITSGSNDAIDLTVDGVAASVTLTAGTYASADALAAEVQSRINASSALSSAGIGVTVTQTGGILRILSNRYGSTSSVSITGGNGASNLLGAGPTSTTGVDAAGTINGVAATGSGQILTGATGNASEGLALKILGGSLGARGNVNFTYGYASQFDQYVDSILASSGSLSSRTDGIDASIKNLDQRQEQMEARLGQIEKRYRTQFAALDAMISSMNVTSTYLTQQLASFQNSNN